MVAAKKRMYEQYEQDNDNDDDDAEAELFVCRTQFTNFIK